MNIALSFPLKLIWRFIEPFMRLYVEENQTTITGCQEAKDTGYAVAN
ncbi:hypothetical protein [Desulfobacula sp.]|nr:hypothetical protein [Desulfobacula sp.]